MIQAFVIQVDGPSRIDPQELPARLEAKDHAFWLHLTAPTEEEYRFVAERFKLPMEHMKAALDANERPRQEYEAGAALLVVRASFQHEAKRRAPFNTLPVTVILTDKLLVTICLRENLVEALLEKRALPGSGDFPERRLALTLLLRISAAFLDHLQQMDGRLNSMESRLKESLRNEELLHMLHLEKSLIYLLTALKGNLAALNRLRACPVFAEPVLQALLDDALIENKQAIDMADIYSRVLESMGDTFGAIISNNLNKVMKVLTSLTVVLMIPSIIGALYGMNVALPGQDSPWAFAVLSLLCLFFSVLLFILLRKKDWM